ncbi:MAG: hypothetical protein ABIU18_03155 [Novosphingobium sp.]
MIDERELQSLYTRSAAKREMQLLDKFHSTTLAQHTELFKWITASLLAINGGAAVTILGSNTVDAAHKIGVGANFVVGIFFALIVGVAAQLLSARTLQPTQALIGYWITVEIDGNRKDDLEVQLGNDLRQSVKWSWVVPALGWMSGLFFAVGLVIIAHGTWAQIEVKNDHCAYAEK